MSLSPPQNLARLPPQLRAIDRGLPSSTSEHDTGNPPVHLKNGTGAITHNNYNYGPGVFNDVRRDQHVQGDQHFRGDQHFGGNQYMLNFTFAGKGAAKDKGEHEITAPIRVLEREPYQTIVRTVSSLRQHVLWYGKRVDVEKTVRGLCDELDELVSLVRWTARSINQFEEVFPNMFKLHPFFPFVETRALEWNRCLKELKEDIAELKPHREPPRVAGTTASGWCPLSQRLRECMRGPRAEMTWFLRIFMASYFFRRLDIQDEGVEAFVTKLTLAWDLHNPKVDTIWVREPTGSKWLSIPLRFCETWKDFSNVIYEHCKNGPEKDYISGGNWAVIRDTDNSIVDQTQFTSILKPEMRFDIGVIMRLLSAMADTCPQCDHRSDKSTSADGWIQCSNADCGNWFHISFHPSPLANVPNIKSSKSMASTSRRTRASTVIPKSATTPVRNSKPSTRKSQRLSTKFHRILATIPRLPVEAEARKALDEADRKAKEDAGSKMGTKTAANQAIASGRQAEIKKAAFVSKEDAPPVADEAMRDRIRAAAKKYDAVCPQGYGWVKTEHGYACGGGGHKLSWEQLGISHANAVDEGMTTVRESAPLVANKAMQDRIQAAAKKHNAVCPQGYRWVKNEHGYICAGGGHKLLWEQLEM